MINKGIEKKKIVYRATHRGSKEMDLLLGSFVNKYINSFSDSDLEKLKNLLLIEDEIIYKWYFKNSVELKVPNNNVTELLKTYKL